MTELRNIARYTLILAGAVACGDIHAQAPAPSSLSATSESASDRAQKETDRTLYWIRVLAVKPAVPKATEHKPVAAAPKETRSANGAVAAATETRPSEHVKVASSTSADRSNATSIAAPGGLDAPAVETAIAAPTLTPPPTVPEAIAAPEIEEPDPGLIMTKSVDPQFPMSTMHRLRKGEVEVGFEVGPDGQVDVVTVVKTSNAGLNNAALNAVRQWQFKPTPHGHTAVVDLAFDLDS